MKYAAAYRCPLCKRLLLADNSFEIEYDQLPGLLGKCVCNQRFVGNPALHKVPMQIVCKCADGNAGLAQFAGFVKCNPADRPAAAFLSKLINGGNK